MTRPAFISQHLFIIAALMGLTIAAYTAVFGADFVDYDDNYIFQNERVATGLTAENVAWAFKTRTASNWHPLTWLSYMIDAQLFGFRPQTFHAVNVALHTLNAIVLYFVLWSMTAAVWRSALVAALFALHPLHVESVAWISERKDLLSTLFGLLAMDAYVRWVHRRSIARYVAICVLLISSLMAKPMWVTFPFLLLLIDFWPLGRFGPWWDREMNRGSATADQRGRFSPRLLVEKLPLMAIVAASSAITIWAQQGAMTKLNTLPLSSRLANAIVSYGTYLFQTVWPVNLCAIYPYFGNPPIRQLLVSGAALLALTNWVAARRRDRPALLVGWLWYLGTLVPVIGLVQIGAQAHADRYTYVPLIGVFLMFAWSLLTAASRRVRIVCVAGSCLVLLLSSWGTFVQAATWRDSDALFGHAIALDSRNYLAHNNLAYVLAKRGDYRGAEEHFDAALRINPGYAAKYDFVGRVFAERGLVDRGLTHFQRIAEAVPDVARYQNNAGAVFLRLGRAAESLPYLEKAVGLDPGFVSARVNRGQALARIGRLDEAERDLREALRLDPSSADAHSQIGLILSRRGNWVEAISHFDEALRLRPDDAQTREYRRTALQARVEGTRHD